MPGLGVGPSPSPHDAILCSNGAGQVWGGPCERMPLGPRVKGCQMCVVEQTKLEVLAKR